MRKSVEDHMKIAHPIVFTLLLFFTFVELIQTAVVVGGYNRDGYPSDSIRDQTRFLLFTSIYTFILAIFYLLGFLKPSGSFLFSIASHGVLVFGAWLFWMAGSGALTHTLGGTIHCSDHPGLRFCDTLNSIVAFGWINFFITSVALIGIGIIGYRSARNGSGFGSALHSA